MPCKRHFRFLAIAVLAALVFSLAAALPGVSADGDEDKNKEIDQGQGQALPLREKTDLKYPNLGSHLDQLVTTVEEGETTSEDAASDTPVHSEESVAVTIYLSSNVEDVVSFLEDNGGDPRNVGEDYIEAYVPVTLLGPVSERPGIIRVREIVPPEPGYGNFTSQGVQAHGVPAWHQTGITGRGVKVGIIDVGFEGFSELMGQELPATVEARCYTSIGEFSSTLADCETDTPHGTASAENVMDMAPETSLYIASYVSLGDFMDIVDWMISEDVDVINRSLGGQFLGPGDGTSPYRISHFHIIDRAVDGGIIFLNSAGNNALESWFKDVTPSIHSPDGSDFGFIEFSEDDITNSIGYYDEDTDSQRLPEGREVWGYLRWKGSWERASTDLDLYLVDSNSDEIVARSEDYQIGRRGDFPIESFYVEIPKDGEYHLEIVYRGGELPGWIQLIAPKTSLLEHRTEGYSINGPSESANPGMLSVGATHYWDTHAIADYSSQGPTIDGRIKPDIVGAACGETASYESHRRDGNLCSYGGTSSASPHVAGLAALVKQRFPDYTPEQIASYLKDNAEQREEPDPNNTWGHGFAQLPSPDRAALVALYNATDGPNWANNTNWITFGSLSTWQGVTTDSQGRVTELNLTHNQLKGEIPAELGSLAHLERLSLGENQLTGPIPDELGSLTNLTILSLWGNELTGEIPVELGSLTKLERLSLGENQLTGPIPDELGSLTNLTILSLWGNELTGEIPVELGSLAKLERLSLGENQLTGPIPDELGSLTNLTILSLWGNELTGEIPVELGSLANLTILSLWGNELTGEIPVELGSLAKLERLSLGENQLTGPIPAKLGSLTNLTILSLWGNELTGEIPVELGSLAHLERLSLGENQLTGPIPAELGSLSNLELLSLSANQLNGEIPAELGNLANLDRLFASRNQLTGEIPSQLARLTNISQISLYENQLTGEIPAGLGNLANLEVLSLTRNQLTGTIPTDLGNLTNLTVLALGGNDLTGPIPTWLGSLTNLEGLYLWGNELTGEIPSELGRLANLEELSLSDNQLSGIIPQTLAGLTMLESFVFYNNLGLCAPVDEAFQTWLRGISTVYGSSCAPADSPEDRAVLLQIHSATGGANWTNSDNWLSEEQKIREWYGVTNDATGRVHGLFLGSNQLTGEIPPELGNLANLERLRLFNNQLTGEIPAELGRLTNLTVLHLAGNQLTGCVPASLRDVDDNDFAQLGLPFCPSGDPLITRYDDNRNGTIERSEVIKAINDYLFGEGDQTISRADVIRLINLYLFGPPASQQSEASGELDGGGQRADADRPVVESPRQQRGNGHHGLPD